MGLRLGIFGGSFNPVHHGHLLAARRAFEALRLDQILFVPCAASADAKALLPAPVRVRMLRAALKGQANWSVSEIEISRGGVSRSIDTLLELKRAAVKGTRFFLLIGSDQAIAFPKWKEALRLSKLAKVCVLARPGSPKNKVIHRKFQFETVDVPLCEISSTEIRRRLKKNLPLDWFLPQASLSILKSCRHKL